MSRLILAAALAGLLSGAAPSVLAAEAAPASDTAKATPRAQANTDLTGQWVAVVTEDWRWRMVTPPKGDYTSLPLNAEGKRVADTWDQAADIAAGLQCKPYGAPGLLRLPGRLRIAWASDDLLRLETDAGTQVRDLAFGKPAAAPGERTWQGRSVAAWEDMRLPISGLVITRIPATPPSYSLKVVTTDLRAGYLRKNGVPYSEDAVLTEYFDVLERGDARWLVVTTIVDDPAYLLQPFITTTHFRQETDRSAWSPTPCEAKPPTRGPLPRSPQ